MHNLEELLLRPSYSITKEIIVHFDKEIGVDAGGLKREFFGLALKGTVAKNFEGPAGHKWPVSDRFNKDRFVMAGKIIGLSLIITGMGPRSLSGACFSALVDEEVDELLNINDLADEDVREEISRLSSINNKDDWDIFFGINKYCHLFGLPAEFPESPETRQKIVKGQ